MSGCGLTLAWFWPNFQQISRKWKATSENFVEVILSLQYCNHKIDKCVPVPGTQLDKLDMIWRVSHQYLGLLLICLEILLVRTVLKIIWTGSEGGVAGATQSLGRPEKEWNNQIYFCCVKQARVSRLPDLSQSSAQLYLKSGLEFVHVYTKK